MKQWWTIKSKSIQVFDFDTVVDYLREKYETSTLDKIHLIAFLKNFKFKFFNDHLAFYVLPTTSEEWSLMSQPEQDMIVKLREITDLGWGEPIMFNLNSVKTPNEFIDDVISDLTNDIKKKKE